MEIVEEKCIDVTDEWLSNAIPNSHKVKDAKYFKDRNGIKHFVDGKNVVLDYSLKEKEVAEWLENTFGGEIYMLPKVNKPDGIKTADYMFRNEYWDLKRITGSGKNNLFHAIEDNERQAHNFIFDVSESKLTVNELLERTYKIYYINKLYWLNMVIIKKNNRVILITKKSSPSD